MEDNESYGVQFTSTNLVSQGAAARYLVPPNGSLGTTWTAAAFNHTSWASGTTGIGFGLLTPGIRVRQVNQNGAYGTVQTIAATEALLSRPPGDPQIAAEATEIVPVVNYLGEGGDGHYGSNRVPPTGLFNNYAIHATGYISIPASGNYTFGLNSDDGGRIRINGVNVMVDDSNHGPQDHVGSVFLAAGLHSFDVIMWEAAGGDEVEFYAGSGVWGSWDASMRLVGDTANGGLAAFTAPAGAGGIAVGTNIESVMKGVNASCYVRVPFNATGPGSFSAASLRMRYNNGYVAWLNGTQIASRNAPASPSFNSTATASRSETQTLAPESVNVTAALPQLINGSNVLALHGMNISAADGTFLLLPELIAGNVNTGAPHAYYDSTKATPGSINGAISILGRVADTQFSHRRGFYSAPFNLAITTQTPGATVRYTTNGSVPTATTGTVYSGPILITGTTVIRAAAFKTDFEPTNVDTQTYLFLDDIITQSPTGAPPPGWPASSGTAQILDFGMDPDIVNSANPAIGGPAQVKNALTAISTVCITIDLAHFLNIGGSQGFFSNPGGRGYAWERPIALELINPPNAQNPNGTSEFQVGCGIRMRGGFSRSTDNPKHAFHLYFRGEYGATKLNYPLFGRHGADEFDQLDLRTAQNYSWSFGGDGNNTFLREESTRVTQLDMGHQSGRLRYLHVYINGVYWGLFNTEERTEAAFSASYYGGSKDDYDVVKNAGSSGSYQTEVTDGDFTAWQNLWTQGRAHKTNPTNQNYFRMQGLAADGVTPTADPVLLDVDNLIDYMLLTFWTGNTDGSTSAFLGNHTSNNWFGSRNRLGTKGGFRFFAHDFEHTFFNVNEDRTGPFTGTNDANFAHSSPMFLHQDLTPNPEFRIRWADRVHKHMFNNGALTTSAWTARWNKLAAIVDSAIIAESARWGDAKVANPRTRNDWINAKNSLMGYPASRQAVVLSQLRADGLYPTLDAPGMAPFGGYADSGTEVVMTNNGGTIYYMPDGSDPRAIGGALRPGAQSYSSGSAVETLIPIGSSWKYLGDGSNQGTAWRNVGFNDTAWVAGNAELGYGDGDEVTIVPFVDVDPFTAGVQKNATTYFRRTFNLANLTGVTAASVTIEYDDAAVIWINGQAAASTPNISAGVAFDYYTNVAIDDTIATYSINPALLVAGTNTIAVEVHQANSGSSDVSFNLSLNITRTSTATPYHITGSGVRSFKVRAFDGTTWSALVDPTFLVDTEPATSANLAITEIMYNPAPATGAEIAAGYSDAQDFEYLELTNIGTKHVDLHGVHLYGPIDFDFTGADTGRTLAPGARVLIVARKPAFAARYGTGLPVAGSYKGSLSNGGERLILYTPAETAIRDFTYGDSGDWPTAADGAGYSLVRRLPDGNAPADDIATNWRTSATLGGNPGTSDASRFGDWKTANSITNDNADDERDGIPAKLEYVLGGTLAASDLDKLPAVTIAPLTVGGVTQPYVVIAFTRRAGADDTTTIVEGTDFINGWSINAAVPHSVTPLGGGLERVTYRSSSPHAPAPGTRQAYRVKATIAP